MNNQVAALRAANIRVEALNSQTPAATKKLIMEDLQCGHPHTRLLYVTPEYCALDFFRRILRTIHSHCELARIAVDEAHCISEWGHDFRPAFQNLDFFRKEFADVPIICCTATATARVREDVISTLALDPRALKLFTMTTSRPNLHYEVRFTSPSDDGNGEDRYEDFLPWLKRAYGRRELQPRAEQLKDKSERTTNLSGIIYTLLRRDCEALAARLVHDGIGAKAYHAGLSAKDRVDRLTGWVENRAGYDVIVATTAFGMGIDKEDVRFVVHWQLPKSFEGFYQEAGRAGRDGKASICVLYYSREDRDRLVTMMRRDYEAKQSRAANRQLSGPALGNMQGRERSLKALIDYCESTGACRHALIAKYFGDPETPVCDWACDWHKDPAKLKRKKEEGLMSEEWCSTQRERGAYEADGYTSD